MKNSLLLQGDCLTACDEISDQSIDLILTDPPYNISSRGPTEVGWVDSKTGKNMNTIHSQNFSKSFEHNWDDITHEEFVIQLSEWSKLWQRKLRKGGSFLIFISDQYASFLWKALESQGLEPKRMWTWKKPAAVPFNRRINPVSGCEYAIWGIKPGGKRTFNSDAVVGSLVERHSMADKAASIVYKIMKNSSPDDNLEELFKRAKLETDIMLQSRKKTFGKIECVIPNTLIYSGGLGKNKIHPTQKPVEIMEYFVELLSNEEDLVLDTFAGSGSTAIACKNLNRNFIMIERDSRMFQSMQNRLAQNSLPETLFEE